MRLIPEITEPTVEAVLEALLRNYTCGALLTILASIHERRDIEARRTCADALLSILEIRRGVIYVKDEPTRNWSSLSAAQIPERMTLTSEVTRPLRSKRVKKRDKKSNLSVSFKDMDVTVL